MLISNRLYVELSEAPESRALQYAAVCRRQACAATAALKQALDILRSGSVACSCDGHSGSRFPSNDSVAAVLKP
jgi:hypothetical protein